MKMLQTQDIVYMDPISEENCWSLFKKHAFSNGHAHASPEFERIGKEIVKKCKGLLLAVKTVGGLLRSKTKVKKWDDILGSDFWNQDDKPNDILPVLRLCYHHLPPHLKHCFAFCAIFPKNFTFYEEELVLLWMANDLLQQPNQEGKMIKCMEDVGRKYFSQLKSWSFFQNKSDGGYLLHDLINDLARYVFGKFCVRYEDHQSHDISREVRHLSYTRKYTDIIEKFKFLSQARQLRTLFLGIASFGAPMISLGILPGLGRLRVLHLCGFRITELRDSLGNLKHLRYINLSKTDIKQLPDVICSLYNLQTLLLSSCRYLDELPKDITKLVNLHHLDLRKTDLKEMPSHMNKLRSLQTLSYFIVDSSPGKSIEELGKLSLHGYLKIKGLQNVTSCNDALRACLSDKNHLEDLVLQWNGITDDSQIDRDILDKLQPHVNLKNLIVDGYGGTRFPDWLANYSFCNIVSLCLIGCNNCFILPTLGHLASLKYLTINGLDSITRIGEEFYGDGSLIRSFASLVTLKIEQMSELMEWDIPPYADFSCLEELKIKNCPKLKGKLPSRLASLRDLGISGCGELVCFNDWVGVAQDNQVGSLSHHLLSLRRLSISDIPDLKELPERLLRSGLQKLTLHRCDGLVSFPKVMARADTIYISNCPSLVYPPIMAPRTSLEDCPKLEFPKGESSNDLYSGVENLSVDGDSFNYSALDLFPKLQYLEFKRCKGLEVFPSLPKLTVLRHLTLVGCHDLLFFPRGGLPAPNLKSLYLGPCKKLKSMPEQMHSLLPSLKHLVIQHCPEIESFPKEGLPSSLKKLSINDCKKLARNPWDWGLQRLPALYFFEIVRLAEKSFPNDIRFNGNSFPDEGLLPCSLRDLCIIGDVNLKSLNEKGILCLTSLESLRIEYCPDLQSLPEEGLPTSLESLHIIGCANLQSLPEEGLPTSLSELYVEICPMLKPHLEREKGKYWPIISQIPTIVVDWELISGTNIGTPR